MAKTKAYAAPARPEDESSGDESDSNQAEARAVAQIALEEIPVLQQPVAAKGMLVMNNKLGLAAATRGILARDLPWEERLDITSRSQCDIDVNDDLKREVEFYNKAMEAVRFGKQSFKSTTMPFSRPTDFFAEMLKTDAHMAKIKDRLIFESKKIAAFEERKTNKEQKTRQSEKKDAKAKEKAADKKKNLKSVEEWQKDAEKNRGMGGDDNKRGADRNFKRENANEKYGRGAAGAAAKRGKFKTNEQGKMKDDFKKYSSAGNFEGGKKSTKRGGSQPVKRAGKRSRDANK